jgi:hypothetical protein
MAGKTEVVIQGTGFDATPESNFILFDCGEIGTGAGPMLTRKFLLLRPYLFNRREPHEFQDG